MKVNDEGLKLIKAYEGLRLTAYPDPATGGEPWTIGYGHTSAAGEPKVYPGMKITRAEAGESLKRDLAGFEQGVARLIKVPLNDNQFSALVSLAYNIGLNAFKSSSVLAAVNAKRFGEVPRRLNLWVKAAGKTMPGLVKRRAAEGLLFQAPIKEAGPSASLLSPQAEEQGASGQYNGQVVPVKGKPLIRSKTVWATLSGVGLGAYAAGKDMLLDIYTAASTIGLEARLVIGGAVLAGIIGAGLFIINERAKKSVEDGV